MDRRGRFDVVLAMLIACSGVTLGAPAVASASESPSVLFELPAPDAPWASAVDDTPSEPLEIIDLQPVMDAADETVAALSPQDWDVDALAATIHDPVAAFELVRDAIGFDAYPGVLRGAHGTLAARAGNAYDRALLLKALLDAQGATSRFAFGRLSPEMAASLVARAFEGPARPLPAAGVSPFDAVFEAAVDLRARRDYGELRTAIGDRLADLSADGTAAAMADVAPHAWIQLQMPDGTWQDLDPSLPDARPGQVLTAATVTQDDVPLADRDMVTLRVIAEMLQDGALSGSTVLEASLDSASAARQQVVIAFQPAGAGGSLLGGGVGGVLGGGGGSVAYEPLLLIDGDSWVGDAISISAEGGGDFFGGGSTQDLASISLEVEVSVPGTPPRVVRRAIVDRVPTALPSTGVVAPEDLLPVQDADGTPAVFSQVLHIMISTGGTDPRTSAERQGYAARVSGWLANAPEDFGDTPLDVAFAPFAVTDETLVVAVEQRFVPALDDDQVRTFIAAPRVYLASNRLDAADPSRRIVGTDLAIDGVRTLPRPGASVDEAAGHQLWYGVLQGAVESELALIRASSVDPEGRTLEGVSFHMGDPLTVVTSADGSGPEAADASLAAILDGGGLAVVPGDPALVTAWWEVTADGSTRSVVAPALGAVDLKGFFNAIKRKIVPGTTGPHPAGENKQGNEYQMTKTVGENATTEVSKAGGHAVQSTFETAAETAARAAAKKIIGG